MISKEGWTKRRDNKLSCGRRRWKLERKKSPATNKTNPAKRSWAPPWFPLPAGEEVVPVPFRSGSLFFLTRFRTDTFFTLEPRFFLGDAILAPANEKLFFL